MLDSEIRLGFRGVRHQINRNHSQARPQDMAPNDQEGVSSTDLTYRANGGRNGMQVKIKDLEK